MLGNLADIADSQGREDEARTYRRRERESFAAFEGNRYNINLQAGPLITAIAAIVGNMQQREKIEAALPQIEANGWHITTAVQRVWAGEWDWHVVAEGLDNVDALLMLRVLETIAASYLRENYQVLGMGSLEEELNTLDKGK